MPTDHAVTPWKAGVSRRIITPPPHVELAGLGYYLNRTSERVADDLAATALVIEDRWGQSVAIVAIDLMYCEESFTRNIRYRASSQTGIPPHAICVNCSHSHNAPTAGFIRGAGEINPEYLADVVTHAVEAITEAWQRRQPAVLRAGSAEVDGLTINRTRENGPVDRRLGVLRVDTPDGAPLAVAINFHSHLTAHFEQNMRAVSRDWPGELIDKLEAQLPGVTALYLQGTCGDVNLRPEFNNTHRSSEPAQRLFEETIRAWTHARLINGDTVKAVTSTVTLPTRRWQMEEITKPREEALYRLQTGDTTDWLSGFAKVIVGVPERLPLRYGGSVAKAVAAACRFMIEWSDSVLSDLQTRPEFFETEVQAIRLGDLWFAAHPSEMFTTTGLSIRKHWPHPDLFMLGYSNGSIGYLPDACEVERKSYAAYQSPKFTGQFPFTAQSSDVMVEGILAALKETC
ncbi:MAG TPA: hypothetical protein GYA07_09865 [Verrucomicrobia bacterium]|nr:hypothetical protein [Verrucomicrobiota bacterium]HOP96623.1 hypothetical protein [Verrucomicrobiota bacterium]